MRGLDTRSGELFSYVDLEDWVPAKHPLRKIRQLVNDVLAGLDAEFAKLYSASGRESIPPERLLRALLLQALFTIRSERQLMEQLDYNLMFRWFVGLGIDDAVCVPTVFTKNRDRLLDANVARKFLADLLAHKEVRQLLSDEHFSVMRDACFPHDGTLIEAWASMKSFQPKAEAMPPGAKDGTKDGDGPPDDGLAGGKPPHSAPGEPPTPAEPTSTEPKTTSTKTEDQAMQDHTTSHNSDVDFRGQKRSNATHASVTDPEARLYCKGQGKEAKLCDMGHALMENRHGLIVETELTHADGFGERKAALAMIHRRRPGERQITLGADKGYDTVDFVADLRAVNVTPHVAAKVKGSAVDGRTTRHAGYAVSQRKRKRIGEAFGWGKTIGTAAKTMLRGTGRVGFQFTLNMAAYNLACLPRLLAD
jgi:transposase